MCIHIYIYILTQSFWTGTKVIRRKRIVQPTGFGACSSTCCQWDGEDVPAPWERSNSLPPVRVQKSCVNPFILYNICSRGVFISNSKLRNFVIVAIECFLQQYETAWQPYMWPPISIANAAPGKLFNICFIMFVTTGYYGGCVLFCVWCGVGII